MPFFVCQKSKFRQKCCHKSRSSPISLNFVKINIFVTTTSFRHFVSFLSKTKSFGAYKSSTLLRAELQTFALIIWTLLDSYPMWQLDFCVETIWHCRPTVCRINHCQILHGTAEHMKRDVVAWGFVFVPNFLEYVSAKNWQNWMTSD